MRKQNGQCVLFEGLFDKPVSIEFTGPDQSSDGGVLLFKAIDEKMKLTERITQAIRDWRQQAKVDHPMQEMLRERIYGIACGYPDCNDAARLSRDVAMKLVCERRDETLASQPTLSRLENGVTRADLLRFGYGLTDAVLECERRKRKAKKVRRITIDMDPTEDPTYGDQQLTFFNAYYDNWCYLPMVTTVQFDDESDHYLIAPVLRPGNAKGSAGALSILKRLLPRLRKLFPQAEIFVRMDGAFATPEVFSWLEAEELWYVVNMAKNSVLKDVVEPLMKRVRRKVAQTGRTEKEFGETIYKAGKWKRPRRAIIKAEVVVLEGREPRDNPRFVITNLTRSPRSVYHFYGLRGDAENRIKELKDGLRFDLTSCTSFLANQFRNLLVAAAYALYQQLRYAARATKCARAQVWILRERLVKIGVIIKESARRILIEAPRAYAWLRTWRLIAERLGAT